MPIRRMSEGYGAGQYLPSDWYPAGLTAADVPALFCPPGPEHGATLLAQLALETGPGHTLHGRDLEPYLRSSPGGPVLFRDRAAGSFVLVQLAWTSTSEARVVLEGTWPELVAYCDRQPSH